MGMAALSRYSSPFFWPLEVSTHLGHLLKPGGHQPSTVQYVHGCLVPRGPRRASGLQRKWVQVTVAWQGEKR